MNELIKKIREYAVAKDLDNLIEAGGELENIKHDTFEHRQIKNTILNLIEDVYNGDIHAYKAIVRECDQF